MTRRKLMDGDLLESGRYVTPLDSLVHLPIFPGKISNYHRSLLVVGRNFLPDRRDRTTTARRSGSPAEIAPNASARSDDGRAAELARNFRFAPNGNSNVPLLMSVSSMVTRARLCPGPGYQGRAGCKGRHRRLHKSPAPRRRLIMKPLARRLRHLQFQRMVRGVVRIRLQRHNLEL